MRIALHGGIDQKNMKYEMNQFHEQVLLITILMYVTICTWANITTRIKQYDPLLNCNKYPINNFLFYYIDNEKVTTVK